MVFFAGLLVGAFAGGTVGFLAAAMLAAGKRDDEWHGR